MVTKTKDKIKRKKRNNTLTVVRVEYVQVLDAAERLRRAFKILLESHKEIERKA